MIRLGLAGMGLLADVASGRMGLLADVASGRMGLLADVAWRLLAFSGCCMAAAGF